MKTVYEASNAVEAHMVADLLGQEGIKALVQGEYLQGAMGELPAAGLVRLEVDESDYDKARRFIQRWEAAQPQDKVESPPKGGSRLLTGLAWGFVIGVGLAYAYFRSPFTTDGMDYNRDGILDDKWFYSPSGRPLRTKWTGIWTGRWTTSPGSTRGAPSSQESPTMISMAASKRE